MKYASAIYPSMERRKDTQIKIRAAKRKKAALMHQKKSGKYPRLFKWILLGAGLLLVVGGFVGLVTYTPSAQQMGAYMQEGTFAEGITVEDVDVSGLTYDEAWQALTSVSAAKLTSTTITFEFEGTDYTFSASDLGITTDMEDVLTEALLSDKSDSFFANQKTKNNLKRNGNTYIISLAAEQDSVSTAVTALAESLFSEPVEPTMVFDAEAEDGEYIYWEEGRDGVALDVQAFTSLVLSHVPKGEYDLGTIEAVLTSPENTVGTLSADVVKIAEYTTSFAGVTLSEEDRVYNIVRMADILNGSVIEPGQEWSLNTLAGERNLENGWRTANTLYGGVLVEEMGGGVCQVSSTIYNAFLLAEVGIVERHAHSKPSSYVPIGLDATVDYGVKDLVINNTLADTIYLVVEVDEEAKNNHRFGLWAQARPRLSGGGSCTDLAEQYRTSRRRRDCGGRWRLCARWHLRCTRYFLRLSGYFHRFAI